ncbi:hypothetical protein [Xanthomonas hortorum]|uniref:hypothetical protein n=1 Tax=Xanthomonas hortorum TaxID=56454 RepID=UPI002114D56E|nr:hypothetical protein [Xanthomonas hortorum]UUF04797.1 hypothetical protein NDY25_22720 [Xanthomonas hortorum pv. pelargonii]UXN02074.1 hypothetical protein N8D55_22710 [Xanthomonas hortorum pv. pelargonii]
MSRYTATIRSLADEHRADPAGTIGYDRMLRTYFAQGFPASAGEDHAFWIGCCLEEFPTLASLYEGPWPRVRDRGRECRDGHRNGL